MLDLIDFHTTSPADYGLTGSDVDFPVATRPIAATGKSGAHLDIDTHKAVLRSEGDEIIPLGVVGRDYKLMPHHRFFSTIEATLNSTIRPDLRNGVQVRTSTSFHGAWARRDYIFPAIGDRLRNTEFETKLGYRVIAWNSLDGSASAGLVTGLLDFFCTNGIVVGQIDDKLLRRHTSGLTPDVFAAPITASLASVQEKVRAIEVMAHTSLDLDKARALLEAKFSTRRAKRLMERTMVEIGVRGSNVFALQSALTFYASHDSETFGVRNTGNDNTARSLHAREVEIAKVLSSTAFAELLAA